MVPIFFWNTLFSFEVVIEDRKAELLARNEIFQFLICDILFRVLRHISTTCWGPPPQSRSGFSLFLSAETRWNSTNKVSTTEKKSFRGKKFACGKPALQVFDLDQGQGFIRCWKVQMQSAQSVHCVKQVNTDSQDIMWVFLFINTYIYFHIFTYFISIQSNLILPISCENVTWSDLIWLNRSEIVRIIIIFWEFYAQFLRKCDALHK